MFHKGRPAKQPIFTPDITPCFCGGKLKILVEMNVDMDLYFVYCENGHSSPRCGTKHRAICKWNNRMRNSR